MARIEGVDLPGVKRVEVGLTYIYGIGRSASKKILSAANVDLNKKIRDLTEEEIVKIREAIDKNFTVEGDLRRKVAMNIKRLIDIGSYRGSRHRRALPLRGQRTKTNARTRKGPRRTIGTKKKETK
uniref:Small ribosomal subunit protein uS13 n=1 Tax=uncultured Nitrospirae bacterium Rifle_16ft_4_minimus_39958 TaxID=1665131 RepID=A0A0H4T8A4_9BACT|nr:30S ribosomal protein S13, small subunit ribosomal protein S13 [uncultured Nitrospirae bacterium Rifle_16ft_4_minimus_39958]